MDTNFTSARGKKRKLDDVIDGVNNAQLILNWQQEERGLIIL